MSENDIMIDLETFGVGPRSAIVQIGACTLDESDSFIASIDREYYDSMHRDRDDRYTYDQSTLEWWDRPDQDEARKSLELAKYPSLGSALADFNLWFIGATLGNDSPRIWANSPAFDLVIMAHGYRVEGHTAEYKDLKIPWKFWQERCYRTFNAEFGHVVSKDWPNDLTKHRADHDAIYQARRLVRIMDRISLFDDVPPPILYSSFEHVSEVNLTRALEWHPNGLTDWSPAEWGNAAAGEMGELCNVLKKILRHEKNIAQANNLSTDELVRMAAQEIGDTYLYLDLIANRLGLDIYEDCIKPTFNRVSERENFPQKLD